MKYVTIPDITVNRLLLRKLKERDIPLYFRRLFGSSSVARHMLWEPHKDLS